MPQSHAKSDTWYSLASLRLLYSRLPLLGRSRIGSTRPSQKSGGISTLADNGCGFHSHKVYLLALIRLMSGFDRRSRVTTITDFAVVLTSRRTSVRARAGFVSVAAVVAYGLSSLLFDNSFPRLGKRFGQQGSTR
jgi:hypothetical protein